MQTGMPHFLFYIVSTHTFTKQIYIPPREYRWENYTLMGNYYSQYEDVAKVCNFKNKRAAKPSINSFSKYQENLETFSDFCLLPNLLSLTEL